MIYLNVYISELQISLKFIDIIYQLTILYAVYVYYLY